MKLKNFLENFIILVIILAIVQTFCDELAVIVNWDMGIRNILTLSGFAFDIIFSIEFIVRFVVAKKKKQAKKYFFYERGWVDFLSSFPLLILNSIPQVIFIIFGNSIYHLSVGFINILKVVKAIRITRVLRLIRLLKIFGKIKNVNSPMAQRHITVVSTIVCSTIIFSILILNFLKIPDTKGLIEKKIERYKTQINGYIVLSTKWGEVSLFEQLKAGLSDDKEIIKIEIENQDFSNYSENYLKKYYADDEIVSFFIGQIKAIISIKDIRKIESQILIVFFIIIIGLIIVLMSIYSRHFVQNITDVIHVMNKGFEEKDYLLEVKIKEIYNNDDVFKLAQNYNEKWLSLKVRYQNEIYKDDKKDDIKISIDELF